jgi:hypothetical protein
VGATHWLFSRSDVDTGWWRVIAWWELRRIPFNIIIGAYGIACLAVFFWAITTSGRLSPGEDAVEPMALMAAPFVINILLEFTRFRRQSRYAATVAAACCFSKSIGLT